MKESCEKMAHSLQKYAEELRGKNKVMSLFILPLYPGDHFRRGWVYFI